MKFVPGLKVDDTIEEALSRINEKDYAVQWSVDGHRVTKCGVVLSSEKRNIVHWKTTDADGRTIDEQKF